MRGAPANERGRCLWIASSTCSRSKRGMSTIALRVAIEEPMITVRPDTWTSGMRLTPHSTQCMYARHPDELRGPRARGRRQHLGTREHGVTRDHDRARSQLAVDGDDELRAVGHKQRDAVPYADAQPLQARGEAVREPV